MQTISGIGSVAGAALLLGCSPDAAAPPAASAGAGLTEHAGTADADPDVERDTDDSQPATSEGSDVFASAAPAAATGQYLGSAPVCFGSSPPANQLDLLYMNGETDPFESMEHVGALRDKIVADWAMGPGVVIDGDGTFERTRYENGLGTALELLTHTYETDEVVGLGPLVQQELAGHCFPGSTDHVPTKPGQLAGYGCKGTNGFHFGETVVQFFVDNPT